MHLDHNQVLANAAAIFWNTPKVNENPEAYARYRGLLATHAKLLDQPLWASEVELLLFPVTKK